MQLSSLIFIVYNIIKENKKNIWKISFHIKSIFKFHFIHFFSKYGGKKRRCPADDKKKWQEKETFENQEIKEKEGVDQDDSEGKMKLYRDKERNVGWHEKIYYKKIEIERKKSKYIKKELDRRKKWYRKESNKNR